MPEANQQVQTQQQQVQQQQPNLVNTQVQFDQNPNQNTQVQQQAPQQTQQQQPVQQQPEPKVEEVKVGNFTSTGNVAIDLFLGFASKHGLGEDSPEIVEAGKGNFAYLESKFQQLGDKAKGYEPLLKLAKEAFDNHVTQSKAADEARIKLVFEEVGGEEQWNKIAEWVKTEGTEDERKEFRSALAQGGFVARATAAYLRNAFMGAGNTVQGQEAVSNTAATSVPSGAPLSSENYQAELVALRQRYGDYGVQDSPEYKSLQQRYANFRR